MTVHEAQVPPMQSAMPMNSTQALRSTMEVMLGCPSLACRRRSWKKQREGMTKQNRDAPQLAIRPRRAASIRQPKCIVRWCVILDGRT